MKIRWHMPYKEDGSERHPDPVWPEGWPIPEIDSVVVVRGAYRLFVKHIDFYVDGEDESEEPFVYIVLSPNPRSY